MTSGGLGCCCCTCAALQAYLECDAITIPGFTRLGDWQNLSSGYDGNCCYRAFFAADDCEPELLCLEAAQCPCAFMAEAPNLNGGTRIGTSTLSYSGCIREIIIYRHFYGPEEQIVPGSCPQFEWCKWVVLAAWRDYRAATWWVQSQSCLDADPPEWLETCPFSCADYCEFYNDRDIIAYCQACNLALNWWRIRVFDELPQGTISFSNSDVLTDCINRLKCVNGPFFTLPFYTTAQCRSSWGGACVCENTVEPTCFHGVGINHQFPDPFCVNPPPTWSIEFGEPC